MKKRIWGLLLAMVLCVGLAATANAADGTTWDGTTVATAFAGGTGTESDPYIIETAGQLIYLRNKVNSGKKYNGEYFRLNADLDLAGKTFGDAIGNTNKYFNGHFDGGNHKISNLTIGNANGYSALFGNVGWNNQEVVIKNLTLVNVNVNRTTTAYGAAALVGNAGYLKLEKCTVDSGTVQTNSYTAGGFVANAGAYNAISLTIIDCVNKANITQTGSTGNGAGGIVGQGCNQGGSGVTTITGCINYGDVSGRSYAAGIIGNAYVATVEKCANYGDISAIGTSDGTFQKIAKAAGILVSGADEVTTIENCYNVGDISSDGTLLSTNAGGAAGIAAFNKLSGVKKTIINCHNVGTVTSQNGYPIALRSTSIENAFYLNTSSKNNSKATRKTATEFSDGTVYGLLQGANTDQVWGQTIGTDAYPVFYNGSNVPVPPHNCDWRYSASGTKITAVCSEGCDGGSVTIAQPDNLVYSGASIEAKVTDTLTTGDVVSVTYSGENLGTDSKPTKPGTYTAEIELGGEEISVTYTIGKATLSSAGTGEASGVYGDKLSELTVSGLTVALNGANVVGTWALNGDMIPGVSTASATATFTPSTNADCYEPLTETVTLSIAKKPVTAVVAASDKVYDGTLAAEVTASVNASDLISGDSIAISGLTGTFADINVGTDKAVMVNSTGVIIAGAENYDVTIPTTATASISKKPLTITASAQSIAFGGSISQTEYTCGELATGDTLESVTLTAAGTDGVGTGTITPSAAKIVRGTDNVTGNYDVTYAAGVLNVGKQTIGSVAVDVTAPVQGAAPQSGIVSGSNYTGAVTWSPAVTGGVFDFDTAYTAAVILTPDGNHAFADTTAVPEGFDKNLNADGTLTLTKTFDKTRLPDLTGLKTSLGDTLSVYCEDAAAAIALLPAKMTFETETGDLELAVQWSCESYEPEVGETNAFTWTVESAWEAVKDSYSNPNNVPLSGTVSLTNAEAVPVTITGAAAMQDLVYDGTAKQGYTGTPTSAEYAGPFTITYTGTKGDGSSYGPTGDAPADAGEYTVAIAVPATGTAYSGQMQIAFSIAKAVPTGEPVFASVYRDGRTLADAGLTTVGGTFSVEGAVAWNDPSDTIVEEGKAYGWTFTPASGNYEPITGGAVVYPAGDAPVIDEPAGAQTISAVSGSTVTMTVGAQGTGELAYQWYVSYDGGKTFEPIDGATQAEYTTSAVKPENSGYQYYCLVTNLYGEAASPVFTLSVINPAVLPKTGDSGSLSLWLAALTASMLALAGAACRRRAAR